MPTYLTATTPEMDTIFFSSLPVTSFLYFFSSPIRKKKKEKKNSTQHHHQQKAG